MITSPNKVLMDVHLFHNNVCTDLNNVWTSRDIVREKKQKKNQDTPLHSKHLQHQ